MDDTKTPPKILDPILRKSLILADLGIDNSTLSAWVRRGDFPPPLVLNPGQKREIVGWPTSTYLQWKADRPQRPANPISANAYAAPRLPSGSGLGPRSAAHHHPSPSRLRRPHRAPLGRANERPRSGTRAALRLAAPAPSARLAAPYAPLFGCLVGPIRPGARDREAEHE